MPIRRFFDERQAHLPFQRQYVDVLFALLKTPKPKKPPEIIERIVYKEDLTASMLADGHQARGDAYRALLIKTLRFTKRLLRDAGEVMVYTVHQEYDMDLELLEDELEEITESFDREQSRSHIEQQRELAKKRQMSSGKASSTSPAGPRYR